MITSKLQIIRKFQKLNIKIVHQHTFNVQGFPVDTYGIIVNGKPRYCAYSDKEKDAFLKGLKGENDGDE